MPTQEDEVIEVATDPDVYVPNRASRRAKPPKSNRASFDLLRNKRPQEKEIAFLLPDGSQNGLETTFLFRSIGSKEWDMLVAKYPPTSSQRADGSPFNTDTFPPALLARVCTEPALSVEEWVEIWSSDTWSRGEIGMLYSEAVLLCTQGFDVPFNASA